ncbi:MAG: hypothetical protein L3J24_14945, partial [Xanthomonadales bacterium]|nr:hypothetical protein [Xanthomonadales bacterium]
NAYLALLAINGPSGKTLQQATEEVRSFLNQKIAETGVDYLSGLEYNNLIGNDNDKSWQNTYDLCNSRTAKNCMEQMHEELSGKPISNARLAEQISRYENLIEFNDYKGVTQLDINTPFGPYGTLLNIKRIYLSDAFVNQSSEQYLGVVIKDLLFWRMILKKGHLLITNMVTIATLSDDINSLSVAIKQSRLTVVQLNQLQGKINPLSVNEIDLGRTFEFEFKYGMSMIGPEEAESSIGLTEWVDFFQPQATHNLNYLHITKPLKKVTALNTAEFYQYLESDQPAEGFASPVKWSPSMLYNPVGKILVGYATPAYTDYIARVHDLNGMFYLLKLQIEIALNPDRAVEQVITNSEYTNPYTLKPMAYNSESHSIYFECMDKTSGCELDL